MTTLQVVLGPPASKSLDLVETDRVGRKMSEEMIIQFLVTLQGANESRGHDQGGLVVTHVSKYRTGLFLFESPPYSHSQFV